MTGITDIKERLHHISSMLTPTCGWAVEERDAPKDAIAYIEKLENEIAQLKRERTFLRDEVKHLCKVIRSLRSENFRLRHQTVM